MSTQFPLTAHNFRFYGPFPVYIGLIFKKSQIRQIFMFQPDTLTLDGEIRSESSQGGWNEDPSVHNNIVIHFFNIIIDL